MKKKNIIISIIVVILLLIVLWVSGVIPVQIARIYGIIYMKTNFPEMQLEYVNIEWSKYHDNYIITFKNKDKQYGCVIGPKYFPISMGQGLLAIEEAYLNNQTSHNTVIVDEKGNVIDDISRRSEITELIKDTVIKGIVNLNYNGYINIDGQRFGELGFDMEEYARANIIDRKQKCVDYFTLEEHDTSYIEEGDVLICTGDLKIHGYFVVDNEFDTKDNSIVVLKSSDYNKMKEDTLNGNSKYSSTITIEDTYIESGYVYLKYTMEDDTHMNTAYNFPFVVKAYINDSTQVKGDLLKGKAVEVKYKQISETEDKLELISIEVI